MARIKVVEYDDKYVHHLEQMLKEMSQELFGEGIANVEAFVSHHWAIYLVLSTDGVPIGFSSYLMNDYYGLRSPTMGNSYLYVKPLFRNGKAPYLLTKQFCKVAEHTQMNMETYFASAESKKISNRVEGSFLYEAYEYTPEEVQKGCKRIKTKTITNPTKEIK